MEKDLENDKLVEFFRTAFKESDETAGSDGWDMPAADLWSGIEPALPSPSGTLIRRVRHIWLPLLIIIALLVLTVQLCRRQQVLEMQVAEQSARIDQLRQSLKNMEVTTNDPSNTQKGISPPGLLSQQDQVSVVPPQQNGRIAEWAKVDNLENLQRMSGKETKAALPATAFKRESLFGAAIAAAAEKEKVLAGEQTGSKQEKEVVAQENTRALDQAEASGAAPPVLYHSGPAGLPSLSGMGHSRAPLRSIVFQPGLPSAVQPEPVGKRQSQSGFFAGIYFSPGFTGAGIRVRTGGGQGRPAFRQAERTRLSGEYGLKLGYQFSRRWAVYTGLSKRTAALSARQVFRINYNPELETEVANGEFETVYALSVPSSYGESEVEVNLQRPGNRPISPGRIILLQVQSRQELTFFSLPLVFRYQLNRGRFTLNFQTGLGLNLIRGHKYEASVKSDLATIRVDRSVVRRALEEVKTTTCDYILGLGIAYQIDRDFQLAIEPTYRTSLNPLVENEAFRTNSNILGVQLGIYRTF